MLDPAFTTPVKLPAKSVDCILTKPVPVPLDMVIVPSANEPEVETPEPVIFPIFSMFKPPPSGLSAKTASKPVALP